MKLIVEVDEYKLNSCKRRVEEHYASWYDEAIAKGIPLPKGHGRLIDENEIKQMIEDAKVKNESSKNFAENIIRFASTIIEADKDGE